MDFALRLATSTYVVRLDSDDRILPGYVRLLAAAMQKAPEAAYAHWDVWELDRDGHRGGLRTLYRPSGYQGPRDALVASLRVIVWPGTSFFFDAARYESRLPEGPR